MKKQVRQFGGFTLIELVVVVMIIAVLVAAAIPSARAIRASFESTGAEAMISSAFSSARAMAAKHHCYAGVRFQKADVNDPVKFLDAPQYMIFIVHDTNATGLATGFRAVEGLKPIKLPDNLGVMDLRFRTSSTSASNPADAVIDTPAEITGINQFRDTTTFSILFSPTGKLIIHEVRVMSTPSNDEIFNTENNVTAVNPIGMFIEDNYPVTRGEEWSRGSFVIYDKGKFKNAYDRSAAWTDYLSKLPVRYINQYTGTMIEK